MTEHSANTLFFRRNSRQVARLTLLFVVSLWAFFGYWATIGRQETISAAENNQLAIAQAVEQYAVGHFRMAEVFQAAVERWLASAPSRDPRTDAGFAAFVGELRRRTGELIDIRIASSDGKLYYFSDDLGRPRDNIADRDYFRTAIDASPGPARIGVPVVSRVSDEWRIPFTRRMQRPHHALEVVNASIDVAAFVRGFETEKPRPNGIISLWRSDGTLLARAPHDNRLIGTQPRWPKEDLERLQSTEQGVFISHTSPFDKVARLVAHARASGFPLLVVVATPLSDVLASWYRQLAFVGTALVIVTLVGVLFSAHVAGASRMQERYALMIEEMALLDPLTGIANRRQLFDVGHREFSRAQRAGTPLSVMMLDFDHFKAINDRWGHPAGDAVLQATVGVVCATIRRQDTAGRLGGEEFAVLLPETDAPGARAIAERVRAAVRAAPVAAPENGQTIAVSVSVGVASATPADTTFEAILSRADRQLYRAKANGRDRVENDAIAAPAPAGAGEFSA